MRASLTILACRAKAGLWLSFVARFPTSDWQEQCFFPSVLQERLDMVY